MPMLFITSDQVSVVILALTLENEFQTNSQVSVLLSKLMLIFSVNSA